ncbi:uncharacterized protein TNCT_359781 [Trichonephila clavata]|uniref:Uncharacterized protein n=1 Tax=Trichonephila clavata TaxID=2740835 RepID=A0A8X6I541_TRICU|nr:uncharacterized protein TNCT_359781 [Trichonephila clavata]
MASDKNFQAAFEVFSKAEGGKDGKLTVDGLKKWFKQTGLINKDTGITDGEVEKAFAATAKDKEGMTFSELKECVGRITKMKKLDQKEVLNKLGEAGQMKSSEAEKM